MVTRPSRAWLHAIRLGRAWPNPVSMLPVGTFTLPVSSSICSPRGTGVGLQADAPRLPPGGPEPALGVGVGLGVAEELLAGEVECPETAVPCRWTGLACCRRSMAQNKNN